MACGVSAETLEECDQLGEEGLGLPLLLIVIICALMIPATFQYLTTYFIAHSPPWRCKDNSTVCLLRETFAVSSHGNYTYRCTVPREEWEFVEDDMYSIVTQVLVTILTYSYWVVFSCL